MFCELILATAMFLVPYEVCPCTILSEEIQGIIDKMYGIAYDKSLMGLAASQIGIAKRIILITNEQTLMSQEFINPVILWRSDEKVAVWAYDRSGHAFSCEYEGSIARFLKCEIDRFNGEG